MKIPDKAIIRFEYNDECREYIFDIKELYDIIKEKQLIIDKAIRNIEHELNGHILLNDEVTWNEEYYTNGKLDYRKLLIALLQQTLDTLKGDDKE